MDHYFSRTAAVDAARTEHRVRLAGQELTIVGASGVFAGGRLDPGTAVLLDHVPAPPRQGVMADVGCGWGPITLTLGLAAPGLHVVAADSNPLARALTAENAARVGLTNVEVLDENAPTALTARGVRLAGLWSNPPIRIGKASLHSLLGAWLPLLTSDAAAHLVVSKNLGGDSLHRWLDTAGYPTTRIASSKGFRVLEVRSCEGSLAANADISPRPCS